MSPKGRPQRARDVIDRSRTIRTPVPASDVAARGDCDHGAPRSGVALADFCLLRSLKSATTTTAANATHESAAIARSRSAVFDSLAARVIATPTREASSARPTRPPPQTARRTPGRRRSSPASSRTCTTKRDGNAAHPAPHARDARADQRCPASRRRGPDSATGLKTILTAYAHLLPHSDVEAAK
jgi:hypothetical protein